MTIWNYITLYLIPGLAYTAFLEYFSTKHFNEIGERPASWSLLERIIHTLFWPISIIIFIIMAIKEFRK